MERQASEHVGFPCERHRGKEAVKFCNEHESALCEECVSMAHRTCKDVESIEALTHGEMKGKRFKQFQSDLIEVSKKVNRLKKMKNEDLSKIRSETNDALNAITEFRIDINWYLDRLETKGKTYIEKRYKEIHTIIYEDIEDCDTTLKELEELRRRLENLEQKSERFINVKLGKHVLTKAQKLCKEVKEYRPKSNFVKMTIDPSIKTFVMNLRWYGKHRTYLSMKALPDLPHLYKVKHDSFFDIRCKLDKQVCVIVDSCQIKDGTLLLLDSVNHNIKQLGVTNKIMDYCELPGEPRAICRLSSEGAAVLVNDGTGSRIYNVTATSAKLCLGEHFSLPEVCNGIAEHEGTFYVSTNSTISSYSAFGELLGIVHMSSSGHFGQLRIDEDGAKLYGVDTARGVITMDTNGENVDSLNDSNVTDISGMCLDTCRQMFVCGNDSVIQYDHTGQKLGELISKKDIRSPLSLCYDKVSNRLAVTQRSKNFIKIFQLK